MFERLKYTELPSAITDAMRDVTDLIQGEVRLLKAELADKVSTKINGIVWIAGGAVLGLVAFGFAAQAAAVAIASTGIAMHWALLIVAAIIAVAAVAVISKGLAGAREDMTPTRSLQQIRQDIHTARERLS